jgi:putative hydrolase of HD superfamily
MNVRAYLDFLTTIEKLKCNTRHSWTSSGRHESVAEHSWRLATMAMLCADEYPELDIPKVIKMCLIHDWGEAVTGDIPAFLKNDAHEEAEQTALDSMLQSLPENVSRDLSDLFAEMNAGETNEAKLFKALDNMEALLSHNEAPLSTWIDKEYELNLTYGEQNTAWSKWTQELRMELKKDTQRKIEIATAKRQEIQ